MYILSAAVPLTMPVSQMVTFCGIGFIVVMMVLAALSIFTAIIGRIFTNLEEKQ